MIFKGFRIYIPSSEEAHMIINALRRAFETHFAEAPQEIRPKIYVKNASRLENLSAGIHLVLFATRRSCTNVHKHKDAQRRQRT